MATCKACNREMLAADSCTVTEIELQNPGARYKRIPYDRAFWALAMGTPLDEIPLCCNDCGVSDGGLHHPRCDMEKCPRCGGQLIACGCAPDWLPNEGLSLVGRGDG